MPRLILEVCVASVEDALLAQASGADRLELNSALELGGLTPSLGLIEAVRQAVNLPIIAMLRPRAGDFCYSASEIKTMRRDAHVLLDAGADGLAFGCLTADFQIAADVVSELVAVLGNRQAVFHRAIDSVSCPDTKLSELADLGIQRVLTSGGHPDVIRGCEMIGTMVAQTTANQRPISIVAGGGVRVDNLRHLILQSRCCQVHGSFSRSIASPCGPVGENSRRCTDGTQVAAARKILDELATLEP